MGTVGATVHGRRLKHKLKSQFDFRNGQNPYEPHTANKQTLACDGVLLFIVRKTRTLSAESNVLSKHVWGPMERSEECDFFGAVNGARNVE